MNWKSKPSIQDVYGVSDALSVADDYFDWISRAIPGVSVTQNSEQTSFHLLGMSSPAIALRTIRRTPESVGFEVTGGFLVATPPSGLFSFTKAGPSHVVISLKEFTPRLPRFIYALSHSVAHDFVTTRYARRKSVPQIGAPS